MDFYKETEIDGTNFADFLFEYEANGLPYDKYVELFQYMVDTGIAWQLQGRIGREAMGLIEAGEVLQRTERAYR